MDLIRKSIIVAVLCLTLVRPSTAKAEATREFVLSCTYGVLAGTLVGAASLAFSDKPGDNLNKVARGASLGLYAGILLGLYVVYGVPSGGSDDDAAAAAGIVNFNLKSLEAQRPSASSAYAYKVARARFEPSRLHLIPIVSERGFEGAEAHLQVLSF
jgi:hypothetical protein